MPLNSVLMTYSALVLRPLFLLAYSQGIDRRSTRPGSDIYTGRSKQSGEVPLLTHDISDTARSDPRSQDIAPGFMIEISSDFSCRWSLGG
jgi:hypothetical protein